MHGEWIRYCQFCQSSGVSSEAGLCQALKGEGLRVGWGRQAGILGKGCSGRPRSQPGQRRACHRGTASADGVRSQIHQFSKHLWGGCLVCIFFLSLPLYIIQLTGEHLISLLKPWVQLLMTGPSQSVHRLGLNLRPALLFFSPPFYCGFWTFFGMCLAVPGPPERAAEINASTPLVGPISPFSIVSCCSLIPILLSNHSGCLKLFWSNARSAFPIPALAQLFLQPRRPPSSP